jgi:hypothetical protein
MRDKPSCPASLAKSRLQCSDPLPIDDAKRGCGTVSPLLDIRP